MQYKYNNAIIKLTMTKEINMYKINNLTNNDDVRVLETLGPFSVIEFIRDLSVSPESAVMAYYSSNKCT